MNIKRAKDKLILKTKEFDIIQILECGQIFSFKKIDDNNYVVVSLNKIAKIYFDSEKTIIESKDIDYFYNFFDLKTDYKKINEQIIKIDSNYKKYITTELRILRQDPYQTIISFIVSANNNIKRIKNILNKMAQLYGTYLEDYDCYAFPTLQEMQNVSEQDFAFLGAGYRAKYLVNTIKKLKDAEFDINVLNQMDSAKLKEQLLKLDGVGPKVADCILLFGFGRTDYFPVDTWIRKAYFEENPNAKLADKKISEYYVNKFKDVSGYAQQYLYQYMITR